MADEKTGQGEAEERRGTLGYDDLSMNEVPASSTQEPSEAGRHAGGLALLVLGVLGAAAFILLGVRALSNAMPGAEAEARLTEKLEALPAWRLGVVMDARYVAGNRLRIGFSPRFSPTKDEERERIEQAAREVMEVLIGERPGRDLYVDGFQGEEKIVTARFRHRSTLLDPGGQRIPDIAVHIAGEEGPGMTEAAGGSKPGSSGR